MGWAKLKNGQLLDAAEAAGFEVLLSSDKTIKYEQNLTGRKIGIVSMSDNHWPAVGEYGSAIGEAVDPQSRLAPVSPALESATGKVECLILIDRSLGIAMTFTLTLNPEIEEGLLTQARQRGVSLDAYLQEVLTEQVRIASAVPITKSKVPELPIRHLGAVASLHRRDIYDDAG